jgi:hypothetical protein
MIDNLSLALSHGLMLLVAWRLIFRHDLDTERAPRDKSFTRFGQKTEEENHDA